MSACNAPSKMRFWVLVLLRFAPLAAAHPWQTAGPDWPPPTVAQPCPCKPTRPHPKAPGAPCPFSCDCYKSTKACEADVQAREAAQEVALGWQLLKDKHYRLAYSHCEIALKLDPGWKDAELCMHFALVNLQWDRNKKLYAMLAPVDALLWRGDLEKANEAMRAVYAEASSNADPALGRVPDQVVDDIAARSRGIRNLGVVSGPALDLVGLIVLLLLLWWLRKRLLRLWDAYRRNEELRSRPLESTKRVDWKVWSITDAANRGYGGPLMDALDVDNNPLLCQRKPSSLLLVPSFHPEFHPDGEESEPFKLWRDFLDTPRELIGMEKLPTLAELRRHRFVQQQAFEDLDLKVGAFDAKGVVGLMRIIQRFRNRRLPGVQATIYRLSPDDTKGAALACVRITCYWTRPNSAQNGDEGTGSEAEEPQRNEDKTVSVFASRQDNPAIDATALSAQRAAFKLFYRLVREGDSPHYATAVACFHQGLSLINQYL